MKIIWEEKSSNFFIFCSNKSSNFLLNNLNGQKITYYVEWNVSALNVVFKNVNFSQIFYWRKCSENNIWCLIEFFQTPTMMRRGLKFFKLLIEWNSRGLIENWSVKNASRNAFNYSDEYVTFNCNYCMHSVENIRYACETSSIEHFCSFDH